MRVFIRLLSLINIDFLSWLLFLMLPLQILLILLHHLFVITRFIMIATETIVIMKSIYEMIHVSLLMLMLLMMRYSFTTAGVASLTMTSLVLMMKVLEAFIVIKILVVAILLKIFQLLCCRSSGIDFCLLKYFLVRSAAELWLNLSRVCFYVDDIVEMRMLLIKVLELLITLMLGITIVIGVLGRHRGWHLLMMLLLLLLLAQVL